MKTVGLTFHSNEISIVRYVPRYPSVDVLMNLLSWIHSSSTPFNNVLNCVDVVSLVLYQPWSSTTLP